MAVRTHINVLVLVLVVSSSLERLPVLLSLCCSSRYYNITAVAVTEGSGAIVAPIATEVDLIRLFSIDPCSGQISVAAGGALDYEAAWSYTILVTTFDSGEPRQSTTGPVLIRVTDVNEPPSVIAASMSVPERAAVGTSVGSPVQASDGDEGHFQSLSYVVLNTNEFY